MHDLLSDARLALRGWRRAPGFTAIAIASIALGIGANTAIFTLVDQVLLRVLPVKAPHQLVQVTLDGNHYGNNWGDLSELSYPWYAALGDQPVFDGVFGRFGYKINVGSAGHTEEARGEIVTGTYFPVLGVRPALGRLLSPDDDRQRLGHPVAVLSHAYWTSRFGADPSVVNRSILVNGQPYTVVGVAQPGFEGIELGRATDIFVPIAMKKQITPGWDGLDERLWRWVRVFGRLKPGESMASAQAGLAAWTAAQVTTDLATTGFANAGASVRKEYERNRVVLEPAAQGHSNFRRELTTPLLVLMSIAAGVLVIACANVANLLLARALRRRREIALRLALGVTRARLASQLLTESLILAVAGGVAGLLIANWGGAVLRAVVLDKSEAPAGFRDPRTILFALAAAVVVGVITGLAPVLQAGRVDLTADLKAGAREGTVHRSKTRIGLLVFQGALSVLLLVGAGLFVRSLRNVNGVRLGYDVDPVLLVNLNMRGEKLDSAATIGLLQRLEQRAKTTPGVEHVSRQVAVPFWSTWSVGLFVQGIDTVSRLGQFNLNAVSPDYFATMGTRILRGRGFTDADAANAPRAMIVSEGMGKVLWPGKDPIGQCIRVNADTVPCTYVVGIAEDIKQQSLAADTGSFYYYLPSAQFNPQNAGLFVRVRGDADVFREAVRRQLQHEMPGASYVTLTPLSEIIGGQTRSWHLGATMFVAFGALALVLAAIGLYSVIAYNVAQRTHELGVRVAVGAQSGDLIRLVVVEGLRLSVAAVMLGVAVAWVAARWLKPLLFEESPRDPAVFVVVTATLVATALAACWVPARRASRVDPMVALRAE
ncbi:MAG TPA: ABC transporter permease [Gemmatimonadales bacterium]|nr:ABC transporter permease [Gemmatimonadales bacterium]